MKGDESRAARAPMEGPLMTHSGPTVDPAIEERAERRGEANILARINAKCVSYLTTSHHIAGASTARRTIGIHMNQAAPAYSPLDSAVEQREAR